MYNHNINEFSKLFKNSDEAFSYLKENNIDFDKHLKKAEKNNLIYPKYRDLARIHFICKTIKSNKILEYGSGFSTYVFHKH